jgi:hypothetical protein
METLKNGSNALVLAAETAIGKYPVECVRIMSRIIRLGYPVNFQKAKLPSKKKLMGQYTILEPLQIKKHSIDLFKIFLKIKKVLIGFICHKDHLKMKYL